MKKSSKLVCGLLALVLIAMFVLSVIDTNERRLKTNFDQDRMVAHIEKLTENGPRSIVNKEANDKALQYIRSQVESCGISQGDTVEAPAYMIQDYVATDDEGRYQNFYLQNLIVHIPANGANPTGDVVMFMGHFDSVPMGHGASDDGVACAAMLEAIRYYMDKMANGYTMENDLLFCFVNGEEYNLYGSRAFMEEFTGFNNAVQRLRFGTNLESRGTGGTLIMFETAKNNYNTVKLFSEVNQSAYTCSIATLVYDMMPNGTDFSNFKEACQGLNMANITGGENYHTQNDNLENVGMVYLSQQAQMVDGLIDRLGSYDLDRLYDADESAIFFSYLNVTTVVYNHTVVIILAVAAILLLAANVVLSRKQRNLKNTAKAIGVLVAGLALSAGAAYACYYLFQLIAALAGTIDIHMVGTITYSNTAIVIGLGLLTLSMTVLCAHFGCKWLNIARRDLTRGFAYIHGVLGIVLSFVLPDASYLLIFSALGLLLNELLVTVLKKVDFAAFHVELLVMALYFPILIPVVVLATSALGMTMAYVYGLVFALAVFPVGICLAGCLPEKKVPVISAATLLVSALAIFLVVSLCKPNASVNLQGKQSISKLPSDDALVYVVNEDGNHEYRIYDLNAMSALEKYAPDMKYSGEYYRKAWGEGAQISLKPLASAEGSVLQVKKNVADSLVYLEFSEINAQSFTVDDGKTQHTYTFTGDAYTITLHSDCTVTVNGGTAKVAYKEVLRDYQPLIPESYAGDGEKLHFNLWLAAQFDLKA
jgi:hypothetical protein